MLDKDFKLDKSKRFINLFVLKLENVPSGVVRVAIAFTPNENLPETFDSQNAND